MTAEVAIEVTNDGENYSGGVELDPSLYSAYTVYMGGTVISSTFQYYAAHVLKTDQIYENFLNYTTPPTFAVYTYVMPKYWYTNHEVLRMEKTYCRQPRYSEEGPRPREEGWFLLQYHDVAHFHIDFSHLPTSLVYNEHYRLALSVIPSRCKVEECSSSRARLAPQEHVPCRKAKAITYSGDPLQTEYPFGYWFEYADLPKNVKNNITVYALEDVLVKVEVWILNGFFRPHAPLFTNTSIVRILQPSRARSFRGMNTTVTRPLSQYVSYTQRLVPMYYVFVVIYQQSDTGTISQALNMPPLYKQYERGRVLINYNMSTQTSPTQPAVGPLLTGSNYPNNVPPTDSDGNVVPFPVITPRYISDVGTAFWNQPASTIGDSKELLDAYFETFQGTTYSTTGGYVFAFQQMLMPYLPYFSNCNTFDSYIPLWVAVESERDCALQNWYLDETSKKRAKFKPLPDHDKQKIVGPFDVFAQPIADVCWRSLDCNYGEDLPNPDNNPRWMELDAGAVIFNLLRYPVNYTDYTGRTGTGAFISTPYTQPNQNDGGGQLAYLAYQADTVDNFIPVKINSWNYEPNNPGNPTKCPGQGCFARTWNLTIGYYQVKKTYTRKHTSCITSRTYTATHNQKKS